jgi:hypothetical protein
MSIHNLVEEVKVKKSGKSGDAQHEAYAMHSDLVRDAINGLVTRFETITKGLRSLSVTDKETLTRFIDDAKEHSGALAEAVTVNPSATARDAKVDRDQRDKFDREQREKASREQEKEEKAPHKSAAHK